MNLDTDILEKILPTIKNSHQQHSLQNAINIGFPTMKQEEWKYTYYNKILQQGFSFKTAEHTQTSSITKEFIDANATSSNRIVFINGIFHNEFSSLVNHPKINFWNSNNATESNTAEFLVEINNALSTDGIFLEIGDHVIVDEPIEIFYLSDNNQAIINLKNKIIVGKNAQVKFTEYAINTQQAATYNNIVTSINVAENANVEFYKIQDGGAGFYSTDNTFVHQAAESVCNITTLSLSGEIIRNVLQFDINGERAAAHMNGLYLLQQNEHVDNRTLVNHNVANCESFELYKGILGGTSTGVFNGKIVVKQAAQKTNAFQSNRNLMLSNDANIYTKPQLEIFADDVKCSHGATSSQIEDSELFYLQARGIGKTTARGLLVFAFGEEIVEMIKPEALKIRMEKRIAELLNIEF
ncbi:MAG TPA: Fe-S cluster assembly protein SufD [Chitinophagales bacterium]|nr:Fe-S cluster assembly protein SufD [Chitinophagales bacterium]HNA38331.1 Fe-S cluster assembly protein SufD [Chitinophagales bacterium]HNB48749.1 Fe-S cluster assembly protein SufD [Chitinophagales bacterium]HND81829.1 Fe-S cluster assembly protein SufD [Chitinophagales bacterium]HNF18432.1 Fe-S cluster assembly protein SufD [Chitinophagales bacterium]